MPRLSTRSHPAISRVMWQKMSLAINSHDKQVPAFERYIMQPRVINAELSQKRRTFAKCLGAADNDGCVAAGHCTIYYT